MEHTVRQVAKPIPLCIIHGNSSVRFDRSATERQSVLRLAHESTNQSHEARLTHTETK
jgi:hypothetical protein